MSWLGGVGHQLRDLFRRSRLDAELEEELHDHFERELARPRDEGLSPIEVRRQARLRAGRLDLAREAVDEQRSGRMLADAVRDVRFAMRTLRRSPGLTAAILISLMLGVGGTTAIFSVVYAVLLRPLPFPQADQLHLVRVWWNDFSAALSPADLVAVREQSGGIADIGAYFLPDDGFAMTTPEGPQLIDGGFVTDELPRVLGVRLIVGPGFSSDRTIPQVLIAERLWRERFAGRPEAIGRTLTLDGDTFTIAGVLPVGVNLPGERNQLVWVRPTLREPTRRGPFYLIAVARLPASVAASFAETRLTAAATPVLRERFGVTDKWRYGMRPLKEAVVGDVRETLLLTFAAVMLVLFIAVANVANLLLAKGAVRARELAVRASIGASRGRLARQLLAESALLGLGGGGLGLLLATVLVRLAGSAVETMLPGTPPVRVDVVMVLFAIVTGVTAGTIAGLLPVLRLPWTRLNDWLRDGGRTLGDTGHGRARRLLVVGEIALTLIVLTGAALLVKSLIKLQAVDPGFRGDGVLTFRLVLPSEPYEDGGRLSAFTSMMDDKLRALPGVQRTGVAAFLPVAPGAWTNNYHIEGPQVGTRGTGGVAEWNVVSGDYFAAMGIRLTRGRTFGALDRAGARRTAVVNQTFAQRHFAGRDVIGKHLKGGNWDEQEPWTTIVGVVDDVPYEKGLWGGSGETVYTAFAQNFLQSFYVVVKAGAEPSGLAPAVGGIVTSLDRRVPLRDVTTMNQRLHRATAAPRFRGWLFSLLGALALVIAVTGIYGVMAYHVSQRRRETAIRRALGARSDQVIRATLVSGLQLAGAGILVGAVGAALMGQSLSALLYRVEPRDPGAIAGIAALLAVSAMVACAIPAWRAGSVDPATILRDE